MGIEREGKKALDGFNDLMIRWCPHKIKVVRLFSSPAEIFHIRKPSGGEKIIPLLDQNVTE